MEGLRMILAIMFYCQSVIILKDHSGLRIFHAYIWVKLKDMIPIFEVSNM